VSEKYSSGSALGWGLGKGGASLSDMPQDGENSVTRAPEKCCKIRKVEKVVEKLIGPALLVGCSNFSGGTIVLRTVSYST
jgi:hypothetical protein